MAGLRGVCMLLEKHRDVICEDLNVDEVVPELVSKGILGVEEEKALVNEDLGRAKAELLVSQLSKKGFAAFQEFCHVLEKSHPHLLTCFLMDVAAMSSTTPAMSSGADSESLKSLDVAIRERDRVAQELNELRGTLTKRKVNKRELNVNGSPLPPEPPDGDGGGPPTYLEVLAGPGPQQAAAAAAAGSSTAGSGGGSELSDDRLTEVLEEPVTEDTSGERVVWEYHHVSLSRVPGYGFGIAVSGGRDNPHFTTGDPSIAISDVLKAGPAEGKLHVNDRVLSANGVSLEHVDYATAVQVLKDSGALVRLYVKRRVVLPTQPEPQTIRVNLAKTKKKDDFGIVLGCKIYVKEITSRGAAAAAAAAAGAELQEGDVILRINQQPAMDGMTLKEAKKLLDTARDRLQLVVRREPGGRPADSPDTKESPSSHHSREPSDVRSSYGHQNLYVQPPTRADLRSQSMPPPPRLHPDDKNNLIRQNGRSRGPLTEATIGQLEPSLMSDEPPPPPRPPLPRDSGNRPPPVNGASGPLSQSNPDYYEMRRQSGHNQQSPKSKTGVPDPRFVSFQKEGSVGIRLTGGNETGIFVTAVQAGSPASIQGLQPGDKIIKVNGMEMKGVTREEAVLFLLSLQDQIDLIVQHRADEYDHVMTTQRGDSFYIRTHFNYEQTSKSELSFRKGDIFHVVDTLNMGVVGAWQVFRIGRNNEETQKGVIPNKVRAEELASAQLSAARKEQGGAETGRSRFFTRRRRQRRSKSLGKDHWEDVVFSEAVSQFPAYERVVLRGCGFVRPVVLFGAVADIARDLLLREMPDKFAAPHLADQPVLQYQDNYIKLDMGDDSKAKSSGIIRLSSIRELVERGRHALLDVTPTAVDRLNLARLYPVCIFLRAESKHVIKEVRAARQSDRSQSKSNKKLLEQCVKLEKLWSHVFTATITLTDADGWYRRLKELIDRQQTAPVWMAESQQRAGDSLSDDFLFPMTSRLSYASSPESDGEGGAETSPARSPAVSPSSAESRLARSSSDPSLSAEDGPAPPTGGAQPAPPPYSPYKQEESGRPVGGREPRYGFSRYSSGDDHPAPDGRGRLASSPPGSPLSPYQTLPHDFRTNGEPRTAASPPPAQLERAGGGGKPLSPPVSGTRSYGRAAGGQLRSYLERADDSGYLGAAKNFTLDRVQRASNYESSASYDSYSRFSNMHDDLKARSMPPQEVSEVAVSPGGRGHEPYRYTARGAAPPPLSPAGEREPRAHSRRSSYGSEAGGRGRASARGVFGYEGGVLHDPETGVAVVVPPGAIRRGRTQEIYFNVCQDSSLLPPLDARKGETLLSPLVMCGPHGLQFDVPVELRLPHCAAVDPQSWSFALKSSDSPRGRPDSWQNVRLTADGRTSRVGADCVSVLVDHF